MRRTMLAALAALGALSISTAFAESGEDAVATALKRCLTSIENGQLDAVHAAEGLTPLPSGDPYAWEAGESREGFLVPSDNGKVVMAPVVGARCGIAAGGVDADKAYTNAEALLSASGFAIDPMSAAMAEGIARLDPKDTVGRSKRMSVWSSKAPSMKYIMVNVVQFAAPTITAGHTVHVRVVLPPRLMMKP